MAKDCCCCAFFYLSTQCSAFLLGNSKSEERERKKSTYFFRWVCIDASNNDRHGQRERESFVVVKIQFWRFLIFASLVVRFLSSAACCCCCCCCYLCTQFAFFTIVRTSFSGTRTKKRKQKQWTNASFGADAPPYQFSDQFEISLTLVSTWTTRGFLLLPLDS